MIIKSNYFIRLCIVLHIFLFSSFVESKEFNYEFHWLYVPVANLSINYNEYLSKDSEINHSDIKFQLSTHGPLKLYRSYSSEGFVKKNNKSSWSYYLLGQDRGQPEEKSITYFYNKEPEIIKFIDDAGVSPIIVDSYLDRGAIDPFSVLYRTIEQLTFEQQCNNEYSVMDGKRRYKVNVELIERNVTSSKVKIGVDDIVYRCKFTLSRVEKEKKKWPFNKNDRTMSIWFSNNLDFKPIRIQIKTPIGRIIGRYVDD